MSKPVVSVNIPAYNNPEYTRKTIQSIIEQDYRPLDILLSDDHSPTSLKPLYDEFKKFEDKSLKLRFFRRPENGLQIRRGVSNAVYCFDNAVGKYYIYMPHDDWFTDNSFISEAVELMESNEDCYLCAANSILEKSNDRKMINLLLEIDAEDKWQILRGDQYINIFGGGKGRIGYQAWSALIFDYDVARKMGMFHYPYYGTYEFAEEIGLLAIDEAFAFQFLLSSIGSVAVTNKVVSVRGVPDTSFCQSNKGKWGKVVGMATFFIYYNIYTADLKGKYADAVKQRAKEEIFYYRIKSINVKLLKHYGFAPSAVYLYFKNYLLWRLRKLNPLNFYYFRVIKRVLAKIKSGDTINLGKLNHKFTEKVRERGLFYVIRRILNPF